MILKQGKVTLPLSLIFLGVIIPVTAIANNVQVRTNNVQASTQNNGSIYVNTGKTSVSIPARSNYFWDTWRYWLPSWQSNSNNNCRQTSSQQTTQVSSSGDKVTHRSSTSSYCR